MEKIFVKQGLKKTVLVEVLSPYCAPVLFKKHKKDIMRELNPDDCFKFELYTIEKQIMCKMSFTKTSYIEPIIGTRIISIETSLYYYEQMERLGKYLGLETRLYV